MAKLLAGKFYDPAVAVTKGAAASVMAAIDTTNLRNVFTVPASGIVMVRMAGVVHGAATFSQFLLGVLESTTVKGRAAPMAGLAGTALATSMMPIEASFIVSGLTPSASLT